MNYTDELRLDMSGRQEICYVDAKQGDNATRFLKVTFMSHGSVFKADATMSASIRCLKPDGKSVLNPAVINADGTVTAELTKQMLAVPGIVSADIVLTGPAAEVLSTVTFFLQVESAPQGSGIASSNEFLLLQEIIEEGNRYVSKGGILEVVATNASSATQAAEAATAACITATKRATDATSALLNQAATIALQINTIDGGLDVLIFKEDT